MKKKKTIKKKLIKERNVKFIKLNTLSKADLSKISVDDLWIIKYPGAKPSVKIRLCGCRNVCLV